MTSLAGLSLDFIDNPRLIKGVDIPEHIKEAAKNTPAITSRDYTTMNESDFGVVFLTKHGYHIPKYPVHDKFHTWAATVAFDKTAMKLPPAARQMAATFIKRACELHGVDAPEYLSSLSDNSIYSNIYDMNNPPNIKQAESAMRCGSIAVSTYPKQEKKNTEKKNTEKNAADFMGEIILESLSPDQRRAFRDKQDTTGDSKGPVNLAALEAALSLPAGPRRLKTRQHLEYVPELEGNPHAELDAQQKALQALQATKTAAVLSEDPNSIIKNHLIEKNAGSFPDSEFGLIVNGEKHYPLYTPELIKKASQFFQENYRNMFPEFRRQFAIKLASKLGSESPEVVKQYSGSGFGDDLNLHIHSRKECLTDKTAHIVLDVLMEKRAEFSPDGFAAGLEQFDREHGLEQYWDIQINDPYYATFSKKAQDLDFYYDDGEYSITGDDLRKLAEDSEVLRGYFDDDMVNEFEKDAVAIFSSMPRPQKSIMMKAAHGRLEKLARSGPGPLTKAVGVGLAAGAVGGVAGGMAGSALRKRKRVHKPQSGGGAPLAQGPTEKSAASGSDASYSRPEGIVPNAGGQTRAQSPQDNMVNKTTASNRVGLSAMGAAGIGLGAGAMYQAGTEMLTPTGQRWASELEELTNSKIKSRIQSLGIKAEDMFGKAKSMAEGTKEDLADKWGKGVETASKMYEQFRPAAQLDAENELYKKLRSATLPKSLAIATGVAATAYGGSRLYHYLKKKDDKEEKKASAPGMTPNTHGQTKPLYGGKDPATTPVIPMGPKVSGVKTPGPRVEESSTKMAKDMIPGGKADKKKSSDFDKKQIEMGMKVEMEHTDDKDMAREISMDHLEEFPDYYTHLHAMEKKLEKKKESGGYSKSARPHDRLKTR